MIKLKLYVFENIEERQKQFNFSNQNNNNNHKSKNKNHFCIDSGATSHMCNNGIRHQRTVPYTPQQNGVAEWPYRTLVEIARCMLVHAGLGEKYWAETAYLRNQLPSKHIGYITPNEVWLKRKPVILKHLDV